MVKRIIFLLNFILHRSLETREHGEKTPTFLGIPFSFSSMYTNDYGDRNRVYFFKEGGDCIPSFIFFCLPREYRTHLLHDLLHELQTPCIALFVDFT